MSNGFVANGSSEVRVSQDAKKWLKRNLDLDLNGRIEKDNGILKKERPQSTQYRNGRYGSLGLKRPSSGMKRPDSAYGDAKSERAVSQVSKIASSYVSRVAELETF